MPASFDAPRHNHALNARALLGGLSSVLVVAALVAFLPMRAFAEEIDTDPTADALQQQVERTAAAYDEALAAVETADADLAENAERIAELEGQIPAQQARSDAAARELYKFQRQSLGMIDLVLSADSFFSFLANLEYVERATEANVAEIKRLTDMKEELDNRQDMLEQAKEAADASAADALQALTAAQEARLEAQRQAQEAARQAAEANAMARAAADGGSEESRNEQVSNAAEEAVAVIDDGADWSSDEAAFVDSWGSRIDSYLSGSPLSGQGRTFAQAAWNYGVDPRWSPAIAYTESSLGAACFRPHNAWGWGSVSWGSWEEAIDAHVRGLARGYGYTISMDAAYKYCPPNAQYWYNTTLGQMNQI